MTNPSSPPIPEELSGPFTIEISINWFLDKFCRGVEEVAVVTREYGDYLRTKDPTEVYIHVEYPNFAPTLAQVYSIRAWKQTIRRWELTKQIAEEERQKRFALEEAAKLLESKYQQREIEIKRVTLLFSARFPGFINKNSAKLCRAIVIQSLQGKTKPEIQKALSICAETIEDFLSLPQPDLSEDEILMGLVKEPERNNGEVKVSIV